MYIEVVQKTEPPFPSRAAPVSRWGETLDRVPPVPLPSTLLPSPPPEGDAGLSSGGVGGNGVRLGDDPRYPKVNKSQGQAQGMKLKNYHDSGRLCVSGRLEKTKT